MSLAQSLKTYQRGAVNSTPDIAGPEDVLHRFLALPTKLTSRKQWTAWRKNTQGSAAHFHRQKTGNGNCHHSHSGEYQITLMKKLLLPFIAAAGFLSAAAVYAQVEYVDPSMGGQGFMLEPTRPTVSLPNSMVRVYPVRKDQLDDQIRSFPLTIISHRLGELFWLMPSDGSPDA